VAKAKVNKAKYPQTCNLELDLLRRDGGLQVRTGMDQDHVQTLSEAYTNDPAMVPPIEVLHDGRDYFVWDGHHRICGAEAAGLSTIRCRIEHGTLRDALLLACGANATHGLRRTNEDKRRAVQRLLEDATWQKRTDRWIADTCQVSHPFVASVRRSVADRSKKTAASGDQLVTLPVDEPRECRDGKVRRQPEPEPKPTPDCSPLLDGPGELLPDDLARKIRNTPAAADPKQVARLARLARQDPELAQTVASMLGDCEVSSVEEALVESDTVPDDPEEEASEVLKEMLRKVQSAWRTSCPKKACPALGAAVLEAVADEWLNGGWFRFSREVDQ
jgi:hypothetical protein